MAGFVQVVGTAAGTTTTISVTITAATTAGDSVLVVCGGNSGSHPTSASDSRGNTYVVDVSNSTAHSLGVVRAHLGTALAKTDKITVTFSAATRNQAIAYEYSGIASATPVDGSTVDHFTTGATITTTSVTPAHSGDLWLSAAAIQVTLTPATTVTVASPFTIRTKGEDSAHHIAVGADYLSTNATARSVTWHQPKSTSNGTICLIAYKVTSGGSGTTVSPAKAPVTVTAPGPTPGIVVFPGNY